MTHSNKKMAIYLLLLIVMTASVFGIARINDNLRVIGDVNITENVTLDLFKTCVLKTNSIGGVFCGTIDAPSNATIFINWSQVLALNNDTILRTGNITKIVSGSLHLNEDNFFNDDWVLYDGSSYTFSFNESQLSTKYYGISSYSSIAGTITGNIASTIHNDGNYDGITLNITEVAGSPGLDVRFNFSGITSFSQGIMRYYTSSLSGDFPIVQLWSYNDFVWEDYPEVTESDSFATIEQGVFDVSSHISGGIVQMRIYKESNGNINNDYYVDWVSIAKGFGVPTGEEIDPLSVHKTSINTTELFYSDVLNINMSWLNNLIGINPTNDSISIDWDQANINNDTIIRVGNTSWIDQSITHPVNPTNASIVVNSTAWNLTSKGIVTADQKMHVGIGTASPSAPLHLSDGTASGISSTPAGYASLLITDDAIPLIYMEDTGATSGQRVMRTDWSGGIWSLGSMNDAANAWVTEKIINIKYDGKIGIGTNAPDGLLHIEDASAASVPRFIIQNDAKTYDWRIRGDSFDQLVLSIQGTDHLIIYDDAIMQYAYGFNGNTLGTDSDSYIKGDNDDNLFYVDAGQDMVGIGTNTPSVKLDVVGAIKSSTYYIKSVENGIIASTTQSQGQQPLTKDINQIAVNNLDDVVTLPSAVEGRVVIVINNGAENGQIFSASGDYIDETQNGVVAINTYESKTFACYDTDKWWMTSATT